MAVKTVWYSSMPEDVLTHCFSCQSGCWMSGGNNAILCERSGEERGTAEQWHSVSISVNKVLLGENPEQA